MQLVKYCKFTVKEVKKAMGYNAQQLFKAGFYASELKVAGYTTERLVETGVLWAPRGVQHHVGSHVFDGWEFYKAWPYNHATSGKDFRDVPEDATWLIIAARKLGAKELYIAAAGPRDVVLKKTTMNVANEANGVFWYRCPGRAFGFSDGRKIVLDTIADWAEPESDGRLSWVMDHKGWLASGGIGEGAEGRAKQGTGSVQRYKSTLSPFKDFKCLVVVLGISYFKIELINVVIYNNSIH